MRRTFLWIAVAIGALTAGLFFILAVFASRGNVPTTPIYVAAQEIPIGTKISNADLKIQQVSIPPEGIPSYFAAPAQKADLNSRLTTRAIPAGTLIERSAVTSAKDNEGQVAVIVSFTYSPQLQPGDLVDIFLVGDDFNKLAVRPLMRNVTLYPGTPSSSSAGGLAIASNAAPTKTFVILVAPSKATALIYASVQLKLAAALITPNTDSDKLQPTLSAAEAIRVLDQTAGKP